MLSQAALVLRAVSADRQARHNRHLSVLLLGEYRYLVGGQNDWEQGFDGGGATLHRPSRWVSSSPRRARVGMPSSWAPPQCAATGKAASIALVRATKGRVGSGSTKTVRGNDLNCVSAKSKPAMLCQNLRETRQRGADGRPSSHHAPQQTPLINNAIDWRQSTNASDECAGVRE